MAIKTARVQMHLLNIQLISRMLEKTIEDYNFVTKCKVLKTFNYVTGDMICNKTFTQITSELLLERELHTLTVFITNSYFAVPEDARQIKKC